MDKRILIVDDDENLLEGLKRVFSTQCQNWGIYFARSVDAAWENVNQTAFDAIVLDISMPQKNGFILLERLAKSPANRDVPVIVLTGMVDNDLKRRALDFGAADMLSKPVQTEDLLARLRNALRLKEYQDRIKDQNDMLETIVTQRTAELEDSRLDIILRLGKAAEYRDEETGNHILRVGCYSRALAETLGMTEDFLQNILLTSPLHDVGKIGISDSILLKKGPLNEDEQQIMRRHCEIGAEILLMIPKGFRVFVQWHQAHLPNRKNENPILRMAATIALSHHEKWDGSGYPQGLVGFQIPLEARITGLADVYDAMRSRRPYKPAFSEEETVDLIRQAGSNSFDPMVLDAFMSIRNVFGSIYDRFIDEKSEEPAVAAGAL